MGRICIVVTQPRVAGVLIHSMLIYIRGKTRENVLLGLSVISKLIKRFLAFIFKFLNLLLLKSLQDAVPFTVSDINTFEHKTLRGRLSLLVPLGY